MPLPHNPTRGRYDMFLVDLGCFTELINRGQLRLIDHGLRDRGIGLWTGTVTTSGASLQDAEPVTPWCLQLTDGAGLTGNTALAPRLSRRGLRPSSSPGRC